MGVRRPQRGGVADRPAPRILIVCTGNVCRSPAAELVLKHMLGPGGAGYDISSAGISARNGAPIDPIVRDMLYARGVDASGFASRRLTCDMLEAADLVLTASTDNRASVVRALPARVHSTLTLKQLARYAPYITSRAEMPSNPTERITWLLDSLPGVRATGRRRAGRSDSVPDPIGRSRRRYRSSIDEITAACLAIAPLLGSLGSAATPNPDGIEWKGPDGSTGSHGDVESAAL